MKVVVALGGNALLRPDQKGTYEEEVENVRAVCRQIKKIVDLGHQVVLTHGNGPQVGDIALQQASTDEVPENPLHVLDAMTQGEIGYMVQRELGNVLRAAGSDRSVLALVTQVLVSGDDPSFRNPTKPIGPFYSEADAKKARDEKRFEVRKVGSGKRAYRRVVPSPEPVAIIESKAIASMIEGGSIVIAGGGGGIPVVKARDSEYEGIDAVIDKDLCAEKLAEAVKADALLIVTNVDQVKVNYGSPAEKGVASMTVAEAKKLLEEGQFPPGSMGPKVTACVRFVEWGGKFGVVASIDRAVEALEGRAGTRVVPG